MNAIIRDNNFVYFENITQHEDNVLWEAFSVSRPGTYIDPNQRGQWDGVYRKYNRSRKKIARPLLALVIEVCKKHNLPLSITDVRDAWGYAVPTVDIVTADMLPDITLEEYQLTSIKEAITNECGIIALPTGAGKTEVACAICKIFDCPTVILADQTIVVEQARSRLLLRDIKDEVGMFYAGHKPNGQTIVVGSIQSLSPPKAAPVPPKHLKGEDEHQYTKRYNKFENQLKAFETRKANANELLDYIHKAEMLLVDECDKACSESYKNLFRNHFHGRRRYGFSGTPTDPSKPVEALVVQEHLGSIIHRVDRALLTSLGRIIPCEYKMFCVGGQGDIKESTAYDIAINDFMVENADFHSLIYRIATNKLPEGDGVLILVDREALGRSLLELFNSAGYPAHFIFGKTDKNTRREVIRDFEDRKFQILIGGKIINRGLDLKGGCERLIVATGGKLQSDFEQKIGRALRLNKRGKSVIYDFYFRNNKYLYNHSKARLKIIDHIGYPSTVIFPNGVLDGSELIRSRFKVPSALFGK
jgi:superfamily II DNA or RNA helicase